GTYAFGAIMTALYQRQATGEGQAIDVSMLESMLSLTLSELQLAQFPASYIAGRPVFGPIATSDGYVNLSVASEPTFRNRAAASAAAQPFVAALGEHSAPVLGELGYSAGDITALADAGITVLAP